MSDEEPKVGDEVAWKWGSSKIEGEVAEKTEGKLTKQIKSKPITKNGEKDNPAYFVKQTQKKGNAQQPSLHVSSVSVTIRSVIEEVFCPEANTQATSCLFSPQVSQICTFLQATQW